MLLMMTLLMFITFFGFMLSFSGSFLLLLISLEMLGIIILMMICLMLSSPMTYVILFVFFSFLVISAVLGVIGLVMVISWSGSDYIGVSSLYS